MKTSKAKGIYHKNDLIDEPVYGKKIKRNEETIEEILGNDF